jgi:hypothetical protein
MAMSITMQNALASSFWPRILAVRTPSHHGPQITLGAAAPSPPHRSRAPFAYTYLGASRRVSQLTFPNGGKIANTYDGGWNMTARTQNGAATTYKINDRNQMISAGGMACSFDINGNLTNRVDDATDPKTYNYTTSSEIAKSNPCRFPVASPAPATRPPTGSGSARPRAEPGRMRPTDNISRFPARTFISSG